jgi:arsenical pump membrane protein
VWQIVRRRLSVRNVGDAVGAHVLLPVLGLVIALGTLARSWETLEDLVTGIGRWPTAVIGGFGAVLVHNLPAAAVLSAHPPTHPRALLLGLNLGPNLAVSGSLSAVLWFRVARGLGCAPSARRYSRLGLVLVPLSLAAALGALSLLAPAGF